MDTDAMPLSPRERLLLLFLSAADEPLDPVRIQKGLFILAQKTPDEWLPGEDRYVFEPYNYGPFSKQIYSDLHTLRMAGYLKTDESWNRSWVFHSVTEEGRNRANVEAQTLDPRLVAYVASIRQFVAEKSFRELLDAVYTEFPEYAIKSVFQH
jgi:hypothetical protein